MQLISFLFRASRKLVTIAIVTGFLKHRGKTIFVISHDDQYFQVVDRLIKLDYGQIKDNQRQRRTGIASLQKLVDRDRLRRAAIVTVR